MLFSVPKVLLEHRFYFVDIKFSGSTEFEIKRVGEPGVLRQIIFLNPCLHLL